LRYDVARFVATLAQAPCPPELAHVAPAALAVLEVRVHLDLD